MEKCWLEYFTPQQLPLLKSFEVDICQSEKDGDLQSKLQAIKTAEEEDFGHSQIGQVFVKYLMFIKT